MVALGTPVNRKKLTHEFYIEKIFEEKQKIAEETAKRQSKEKKAQDMAHKWVTLCNLSKQFWIKSKY